MEPPGVFGFVMEDFAGYSMAWSPFLPNRLAVAASQYYGIVGNGRKTLFDGRKRLTLRSSLLSSLISSSLLFSSLLFSSLLQVECMCWM